MTKAGAWGSFASGLVVFGLFFYLAIRSCPQRYGVPFRLRLGTYFPQSFSGKVSEGFNAVFAIISCAFVIVSTYPLVDPSAFAYKSFAVDLFLNDFWALLYMLNWYTALDRLSFTLELQSLVDVCTIVPEFVTLCLSFVLTQRTILHFLNLLRVLRVLRLLRLFRTVRFITGSGKQTTGRDASRVVALQFSEMALKILTCFVLLAGFFNFLCVVTDTDWGTGKGTMNFHDAMYFVTIGFSTVGYGDITPPDAIGRLIESALIVVMFAWIPIATARIGTLLQTYPRHSGALNARKGRRHLIVSCDASCLQVARAFLKELLLQVGYRVPLIVLVVPGEPDVLWSALMLEYSASETLEYRNGDLRNVADHEKLRLREAAACFILSDRTSHDTIGQDRRTLMRALTVHDVNPHLELYCLVTHTETRAQMVHMGLDRRRIVCANRLVMQMLAAACRQPGLSTIAANLVRHMPELDPILQRLSQDSEEGQEKGSRGGGGGWLRGVERLWQRMPWCADPLEGAVLLDTEVQYLKGLRQVVVLVEVGRYFSGHSIRAVALDLYRHCKVVLVAVTTVSNAHQNQPGHRMRMPGSKGASSGSDSKRQRPQPTMTPPMLYPGAQYIVQPDDRAYVIVGMGEGIDKVNSYCRQRRQQLRKGSRGAADELSGTMPQPLQEQQQQPGCFERFCRFLRGDSSLNDSRRSTIEGRRLSEASPDGVDRATRASYDPAAQRPSLGLTPRPGDTGAKKRRGSTESRSSVLSCELEQEGFAEDTRRSFHAPNTSDVFGPLAVRSSIASASSSVQTLDMRRPGQRRPSLVPSESDAAGRVVIVTQTLVAVRRLVLSLCGGAGIYNTEDVEGFGLGEQAGAAAPVHVTVVCPFLAAHEDVDVPLEQELTKRLPGRELCFVKGPLTAQTIASAHPESAQLVCLAAAQVPAGATPVSSQGCDNEMLQVLASVLTIVGIDVRVVMALNNARYSEQHAVLSTRMRLLQLIPRRVAMRRLFLRLYSTGQHTGNSSGSGSSSAALLAGSRHNHNHSSGILSSSSHRTGGGGGSSGGASFSRSGGNYAGAGGGAGGGGGGGGLYGAEERSGITGPLSVSETVTSDAAGAAQIPMVPAYFQAPTQEVRPQFMGHFALKTGYTSGNVVLASTAELLLVQTYAVVGLADVFEMLLASSHEAADLASQNAAMAAAAAPILPRADSTSSGEGDEGTFLDASVKRQALGFRSCGGAFVERVRIPTGFWEDVADGRCLPTYGELTEWLLREEDAPALGLFRRWGSEAMNFDVTAAGAGGTTSAAGPEANSKSVGARTGWRNFLTAKKPTTAKSPGARGWNDGSNSAASGRYGTSLPPSLRDTLTLVNPSPNMRLSTEDQVYAIVQVQPPDGPELPRHASPPRKRRSSTAENTAAAAKRADRSLSQPRAKAVKEVLRAAVAASSGTIALEEGQSLEELIQESHSRQLAASSAGPPPPRVVCAKCGASGWAEGGRRAIAANCGHVLHKTCLQALMAASSGCPACGEAIRSVLPLSYAAQKR